MEGAKTETIATKPLPKKKLGQPSASEDTASPFPDMALCQKIHRLTVSKVEDTALQTEVFEEIANKLENPSLYRDLRKTLYGDDAMMPTNAAAKLTDDTLKAKEAAHAETMKELEKKVEEAKESAGDMEVMDARVEIARFAAKSLSETEALDAYQKVLDLPKISSGKKIDALMESARVASFYGNNPKADECIEGAHKLAVDGGGDWDRRNRLKVYRALQHLLHRKMEDASELLLDCIATFSCNEICTYADFIVYTVLSNMLHLPRRDMKTKIIDGPEILSVAEEIPVVLKLVRSYYDCDYKAYLHAMVDVEAVLLQDRYLHPHASFWMRELHILAYKQFLDAYQSVTLQAMADAFGVSTDFVDYHASRFITAGRLSAKIDKYGGVIVTNRPDEKNAQYREMIQKGDLLLNRIQKLARVVDL